MPHKVPDWLCFYLLYLVVLPYFCFLYELGNFSASLGIFGADSWEFEKIRVETLLVV